MNAVAPLIASLVLAAAPSAQDAAPSAAPAPAVTQDSAAGDEEPFFQDLAGKRVRASDHRGEVVLLNFWATWCGPCRTEMPALVAVHHAFADKGLRVIGVAADGPSDAAKVAAVAKDAKVDYDLWCWASATDMRRYGVGPGIPATILFDREGRVVARHSGVVTEAMLTPEIQAALDAGAAPSTR